VPVARSGACADPRQCLRTRHRTRANEWPQVVEHARVLRRCQRIAMLFEVREKVGAVGWNVIAATTGIGDDECRTGLLQLQRSLALRQQRAGGPASLRDAIARADRTLPLLIRRARTGRRQPALRPREVPISLRIRVIERPRPFAVKMSSRKPGGF
jgi:hypothetical protein